MGSDPPGPPDELRHGFQHAQEVGTRLTYLGAGNVGTWFSCDLTGQAGCGADSGYQQYLAADDDNGNLSDGTPHMQAIFDAFDRHGIACSAPTVVDSGCAGVPTTVPVVTATARDRGVELSWGAVTNASSYQIFRTDGVFGCDFGKIKVGETTATSFIDSGLQNGRDYSYIVIPMGPADSCLGPASSCTMVIPVAGDNLAIDTAPVLTILTGDSDAYLDNCESAILTFDVSNTGIGSQTSVRIDAVRPLSHPGISIDSVNAVAPSTLIACSSGSASFDFTASGLAFGDTVVFEVDLTSDELYPIVRTQTLTIDKAESDVQFVATKTYDFETDLEGWEVIQGTFSRSNAGGGANGSSYYVRSSSLAPLQCDRVRSSVLKFTATTTMALSTNFDIEQQFLPGIWFDRANIAVIHNGVRSLVEPDSGRLYNASGPFGTCVTANQNGWADINTTWASSGFSATALGSVSLAGELIQLDIAYGTDELEHGDGFRFDQLTLTDVEIQLPDSQSDACAPECNVDPDCEDGLFCNGAETCVAGACQAGSNPCPGQSCDEDLDTCGPCQVDADCDDGLFCNGDETCDAGTCQDGSAPNCDDGVACTVDSCNGASDSCDNVTNDALCDNGLFCDGSETCSAVLGCQAGVSVDCDDGVGCTADSCNEASDSCNNVTNDGLCDNGVFCDGSETCDAVLDCQAPVDVACPGQSCDEDGDTCFGVALLEWGSVSVGGTAVTVDLTNIYVSPPVVVTTLQYANSTKPTVTRVSNVTTTSFDVRLQNPSGGSVVTENVSYLVVEEGTWTVDGYPVEAQIYTSTVTDENNSWVGEVQSYKLSYTNPVVLGQVLSENDADFSVFWDQGSVREDPPSAAALTTGKTVGEDSDVTRSDETVGFIVFEAGHGTIGGVAFEAALGADTVEGVGNLPPYIYTFNTPFAGAPSIALLTMAGVAYVVFEGQVLYPPCSSDVDCDDLLPCNGVETCVNNTYCQAGTPVVCADAFACTVDSCLEVDEGVCNFTPDDDKCDNGDFCDGSESCDVNSGCQAGTPEVLPNFRTGG